eukprot:CAMPEP_0175080722 /NCGR_PEP_ID=MMETSP0052_2-20121109/25695_1 /TAXON_ID=51329 ORGANISM="Polytomella parva, Strain SAG 63-3" /NCGR_SAMPLE_ID=MMETSP0052_2 /ASSEMBLY_ACC=CAM_ASM_000194 /LENGTH=51 /DNA_ID=CAMNT_0016351513 /DNA_START=209 /DNA_END=364 /DNA_ORIENTATION=+
MEGEVREGDESTSWSSLLMTMMLAVSTWLAKISAKDSSADSLPSATRPASY